MRVLPFWLVYQVPLALVLGVWAGGAWTFAPLVLLFGVTPLLDTLVGVDRSSPDADSERSWRYDLPLWLWVPTQLALTVWAVWLAAGGALSALELTGVTLSLGVVAGGGGINIAHELMHRRGRFERALAEVLMSTVSYPHFCVEHVHGHHKRVATPGDPASARLGESLYAFYPRCVVGSLVHAWRIESERVRRAGYGRLDLRDRRLRYALVLALAHGGVLALGGWMAALVFAGQGMVAFTQLEIINYIEHYGLTRREIAPGVYERVAPRHSWNSAHRLTGWYLFNLPRHADHHYLASRPYWALRDVRESPELPAGYATMFLVALVPPLWRRIMDPRARAWSSRTANAA